MHIRMRPPRAMLLTVVALLCASLPADHLAGQTTEEERAEALERTGGRLTNEGASGRLVERTPGSYDFVPVDEPLALAVANPEQVAAGAVGPVLRVYGALNGDGELLLQDYRIDLAPAAAPAAPADPLQQELGRVLQGFAATVNEAIKPSDNAAAPEFVGATTRSRSASSPTAADQITDLYARAVEAGDAEARSAAVSSYVMVRQVEKAIYDTYDNYPPWNYARIFATPTRSSRSALPGRRRRFAAACSLDQTWS